MSHEKSKMADDELTEFQRQSLDLQRRQIEALERANELAGDAKIRSDSQSEAKHAEANRLAIEQSQREAASRSQRQARLVIAHHLPELEESPLIDVAFTVVLVRLGEYDERPGAERIFNILWDDAGLAAAVALLKEDIARECASQREQALRENDRRSLDDLDFRVDVKMKVRRTFEVVTPIMKKIIGPKKFLSDLILAGTVRFAEVDEGAATQAAE